MKRAIAQLTPAADSLLIDFVKLPVGLPQRNLVHGDAVSFSIAAASILAKTARDRAIAAWDAVFPEFGLASNKGYSAPVHLEALGRLGPTPLHRFSFEPVRAADPRCRWAGYPVPQDPQGELFE
jgi:ribonuclease HII